MRRQRDAIKGQQAGQQRQRGDHETDHRNRQRVGQRAGDRHLLEQCQSERNQAQRDGELRNQCRLEPVSTCARGSAGQQQHGDRAEGEPEAGR